MNKIYKPTTFISRLASITVALSLAAAQAFAQEAPDSTGPWFGLWKYNNAKTAAANNQPAPAQAQAPRFFRMIKVSDDAFYYTIETMPDNDGNHVVQSAAAARFDGKEYVEVGEAFADANKFRILDPHTYELVDVKDGRDALHFHVRISADGKTRTSTMSVINEKGEKVNPRITIAERVE